VREPEPYDQEQILTAGLVLVRLTEEGLEAAQRRGEDVVGLRQLKLNVLAQPTELERTFAGGTSVPNDR
jgi:hypothetical protein